MPAVWRIVRSLFMAALYPKREAKRAWHNFVKSVPRLCQILCQTKPPIFTNACSILGTALSAPIIIKTFKYCCCCCWHAWHRREHALRANGQRMASVSPGGRAFFLVPAVPSTKFVRDLRWHGPWHRCGTAGTNSRRACALVSCRIIRDVHTRTTY